MERCQVEAARHGERAQRSRDVREARALHNRMDLTAQVRVEACAAHPRGDGARSAEGERERQGGDGSIRSQAGVDGGRQARQREAVGPHLTAHRPVGQREGTLEPGSEIVAPLQHTLPPVTVEAGVERQRGVPARQGGVVGEVEVAAGALVCELDLQPPVQALARQGRHALCLGVDARAVRAGRHGHDGGPTGNVAGGLHRHAPAGVVRVIGRKLPQGHASEAPAALSLAAHVHPGPARDVEGGGRRSRQREPVGWREPTPAEPGRGGDELGRCRAVRLPVASCDVHGPLGLDGAAQDVALDLGRDERIAQLNVAVDAHRRQPDGVQRSSLQLEVAADAIGSGVQGTGHGTATRAGEPVACQGDVGARDLSVEARPGQVEHPARVRATVGRAEVGLKVQSVAALPDADVAHRSTGDRVGHLLDGDGCVADLEFLEHRGDRESCAAAGSRQPRDVHRPSHSVQRYREREFAGEQRRQEVAHVERRDTHVDSGCPHAGLVEVKPRPRVPGRAPVVERDPRGLQCALHPGEEPGPSWRRLRDDRRKGDHRR